MEARPPAENRHGGAPRGERPASWDAPRPAGCGSVAPHQRDNRTSAPVGAPPAPRSGMDAITRTPPGRKNAPRERGGLCRWMYEMGGKRAMSKTKPRARVDADADRGGAPPRRATPCRRPCRDAAVARVQDAKPAGAGAAAVATSIDAARAARRRPGPGCIRFWRRSAAGRRGARPCVVGRRAMHGAPSRGSSISATRWMRSASSRTTTAVDADR